MKKLALIAYIATLSTTSFAQEEVVDLEKDVKEIFAYINIKNEG
jgi:Asp-tRNA(Asn)/Glu-tRNA(Gln) amidotransferase C subunit